ncbi:hypothetical protein [Methylobacterium sp. 77]|uniref:hypothetical protein n=1 Tax=Methylobacterium sp. 77 TaxID=1101192 RepID=UPI0003A11ECC|nr:hypothetical protein [Methylobacterium sp. 77]
MVIPTPGVIGILIGSVCALAIVASAIFIAVDRLAGRLAMVFARGRTQRRAPKRAVHANSGMSRKI